MKLSAAIHIIALMGCMSGSFGFIQRLHSDTYFHSTGAQRPAHHIPEKTLGGILQSGTSLAHVSLSRQRRSVTSVLTQGIFGLGGPEIAIILVAAAFLIGPQQLGKVAGQFKNELDNVPDELKKIPKEFQKGVEEGETNARARNAKQMKPPPADSE
jgi:sec-independent protein translocase protein TatA